MAKDYYTTLGVAKGSTKEDIKKAYKKLAMKYHPDRAPEEKKKEYEEKFKEISEAAATLSDDKKRSQFDQFGTSGFEGGEQQGYDFSDIMSQFRSGSFGDFDGVFESIFGGGGGRRARKGADLLYEMEVTLQEVLLGVTKNITLNKLEHCSECSGQGFLSFEKCSDCQGSGYVKRTQRTPFGIFAQTAPCGTCQGLGQRGVKECSTCGGEGAVRKRKEIEVAIPAGVEDGMRLRVRGEGQLGDAKGQAGDLFVETHYIADKYFSVEGRNVLVTVPISFSQAALGDEIEVPTLDSKADLTIPSGTHSETVFRMRGKGLPSVQGASTGDQLVKVRIEVPRKLTKKQMDLLKQFGEEKPSEGFLKKIFG